MYFLNVSVCSAAKRPTAELFGTLFKKDMSNNIQTLITSKTTIQSIIHGRNPQKKLVGSVMRSNFRFSSGNAAQDRFIPKDPFEKKNLWKSVLIVLGIGAICTGFMVHLRKEKLLKLEKERKRALGKAAIGGKFELVDENNKLVKSEDFLGKWLLIYFGFTHCPDICPDEMEKMVNVVDKIEKDKDLPNVTPIFITVDPVRDTPQVVGKYVKEFSNKIIGLTGSLEQIGNVCKAYRVYFSAGPKDKDADYIVDHSIIMYLIDPNGEFMDYYGANSNADQIVEGIRFNYMKFLHINDRGSLLSKLGL